LGFYIFNLLRTHNERQRQVQLQRKKQEFISSYSEYSVQLASLSSYQAMAKQFLDRVQFVTGAKHVKLRQMLLDECLESSVGNLTINKFSNAVEQTLLFNKKEAQMLLYEVNESELQDLSGDMSLLYQQMILAQENLIERTKFKWNEYHNALTGLFSESRFFQILREELARADVYNINQSLLFWEVDTNYFMQNNIIERIHMQKYGELIKEVLGKHVVASYIDSERLEQWLARPIDSGFVIYLGDTSNEDAQEAKRKISELVKAYKDQQPNSENNKLAEIIKIHDTHSVKKLCQVLSSN